MIWKPIPGYEGIYEVSNEGLVRSLNRVIEYSNGKKYPVKGKVLTPVTTSAGYLQVSLSKNGKIVNKRINRLVLDAFSPTDDPDLLSCHNDGNKLNNHLDNLRWGTASENNYDMVKHGTHSQSSRESCPLGHALSGSNIVQRATKQRGCKACARARAYLRNCGSNAITIELQILADLCYEHDEVPSKAILRYDG